MYYIAVEGELLTLYHLPKRGARARKVAAIDGPLDFGLDVSPDGKTFIYSKLINSGTDLMLAENYR